MRQPACPRALPAAAALAVPLCETATEAQTNLQAVRRLLGEVGGLSIWALGSPFR